ncbi:MAG: hypothetical protein R2712_11580 [Vicinamibacterales bacterium]
MRICRRVLVTGLWLTVAAAASAQSTRPPNPFGEPDRRTTNHLSLDAQVSRTSVAPGGSLTLRVDVTPRPAMHVYAPGEHDYQVIQLAVAPQPWLRAGPTEYPASETY